jgi:hypothetical protein
MWGCAALALAVVSVWQHSYEATLVSHKAKLLDTIARLQREVDDLHLGVTAATARGDVRGVAEKDLGLRPAPSDRIVVIAIPREPSDAAPSEDASVAELGRRFLDELLPVASAGSRARVPVRP